MLQPVVGAIRCGWRFAAFVLTLSIASGGEAWAQPASTPTEAQAVLVNGLLVKFRDAPSHQASHEALRKTALSVQRAAVASHQARMQRALQATGLGAAHQRPLGLDAWLLQLAQPLTASAAEAQAQLLRQQPDVEWAVPNSRERRLQVPNDPMFAASPTSTGQWWLHPVRGSNTNALSDRLRGVPGVQTAWASVKSPGAVVIAVLDTGITAHLDLDANVLPGYDFVSTAEYAGDGDGRDTDPSDPGDFVSAADKTAHAALFNGCAIEDSSWHGTNIAGIIAAVTDNGIGVAGANGRARIVPVRVAGKCGADVGDIIDGMYWAAGVQLFDASNQPLPLNTNPAKVVNISFGGSDPCHPAYQAAIDALATRGVVVVAAAGNEHGAITRPASCDRVVGVAAVNRDGFKAHYSNFGSKLVVATVGGDPVDEGRWGSLLGDDGLLTVDNIGRQGPDLQSVSYSRIAGTSFATPVVASVISLMLSVNPALSVAQIITGLRVSARPHVVSALIGTCSTQNPGRCICTTQTCGAGLLDAAQALAYAQSPATYVAPAAPAVNIDNADVNAAVALGADLDANPPANQSSGGSGGGAWNPLGLFALMGAVAALARRRD